jgi:hypothetical protein
MLTRDLRYALRKGADAEYARGDTRPGLLFVD